ncbi:hypothetical protein MIZ03_3576 [Rhodoferax lithotrophicus]|uniref:Uncharacterized protein n=1 Tax=Rhodoferax lithotrophicus TaxID=2798804 RepID=A0ABN6DD11_9BURK|nr:hypothetical protein MIZ03_3576 [Rhodoferax sp. MIZ03]
MLSRKDISDIDFHLEEHETDKFSTSSQYVKRIYHMQAASVSKVRILTCPAR